jgi:predicted nucleotidyltransferase
MFKELNILKIFMDSPNREFNVREFARLLRIAPATASKELRGLSEKGLLLEKKERRFKFYRANLDNDHYRDLKVFYNIQLIRNSGLLSELNKFYLKPTIILFGSASQGLDTETSDFDLVIISEKIIEFTELARFEKIMKKNIQIFAIKHLKDLKNEHLINNVLNGIVLQGEIKWI